MKKIIGLFSILIAGLLCFSCSDFLEETPKTDLSTSQLFSSPVHAWNTVNGLYRQGAPNFYADGGVYMPQHATHGGFLSGFFDNEYKGQEVICDYSQKLSVSPNNISGPLDDIWRNAYSAIARANTAIKGISAMEVSPDFTEATRTQLLGEAKFFRAFNYFYLVRYFGDVPLILEAYESLDGIYAERTPTADVYAQIVADLNEAIDALPATAFCDNSHRIGKYTAATVLAHVYLQMSGYPLQANKYADAANAARIVINSGKHRLIANGSTPEESAYNVIRTVDDDPEYIYNLEFVTGIATNNGRVQTSLPNIASTWSVYKHSITNNAYRPVKEYMNVYDKDNDLRAQQGQFFFYDITYEKEGQTITYTIPADISPSPHLWFYEPGIVTSSECDKDFTIYRYAEVLLIAAEAIAKSEGVTAEAVQYLTDVRARAYTTTPRTTIENTLNGLSADNFVQQVWLERMRELVFEFRIWDDIRRTRLYPSTSDAQPGTASFIPLIGAVNPWGQTFAEKHLLWPISANEIQRNPALTQNPGYN